MFKNAIKNFFRFFYELTINIYSLIRVIRHSTKVTFPFIGEKNQDIIILGNGPSASEVIEEHLDYLKQHDVMCVNFFPLTKYFMEMKPLFLTFVDPGFWQDAKCMNRLDDLAIDESLTEAQRQIRDYYRLLVHDVDWEMYIYASSEMRKYKDIAECLGRNKNLHIVYQNSITYRGVDCIKNWLLDRGYVSFSFQNVLVAAMLAAIHMHYRNIYLFGADHDWFNHIKLDINNHIYREDAHSYELHPKFTPLRESDGKWLTMSELFRDLTIAFGEYEKIEQYAKKEGIRICNASSKSFIDAFERIDLFKKKCKGSK